MIPQYCCYSKATYIFSIQFYDTIYLCAFTIAILYCAALILVSTSNVSNVSLTIHILSSRALRLTLQTSRRSTLCPGHCQNSQMSSFLYKFEIFFSDLLSALKQRPERQPCQFLRNCRLTYIGQANNFIITLRVLCHQAPRVQDQVCPLLHVQMY